MVRDRHLRLLYQDSPCSNQHVTNMNSGSVQTGFSVFLRKAYKIPWIFYTYMTK